MKFIVPKLIIVFFFLINSAFSQYKAPFAKNLILTDINGNTYSMYEELLQGKLIVFDFFSYYCVTCQNNTPIIDSIWHANGGADSIWVWGVETSGYDSAMVQTFSDTYGSTFPVFSTKDGINTYTEDSSMTIFDMFNLVGTPTYVLVCFDSIFHTLPIDEVQSGIDMCSQIVSIPENINESQPVIDYIVRGNNLEINVKNGAQGNYYLDIFNILGARRKLINLSSHNGHLNERVDLSDLSKGCYIIRLLSDDRVVDVRKIIK